MTISRLLMPAVTLAGALALAGCGGGSSTPTTNNGGGNGGGGDKPADCSAAGVIPDPDNPNACKRDPDYVDPAAASKERTANAKTLMTALGQTTGGSNPLGTDGITERTTSGSEAPAITNLKKTSATVTALAGWKGAHYEGSATNSDEDKFTGEVRAYSNQEAAGTQPFTERYDPSETTGIKYYTFGSAAAGILPVGDDKVKINGVPPNGVRSVDAGTSRQGTYDGASGTYACAQATDCTVSGDGEKVTALGAGWRFTPASGVTVPKGTAAHLQFGWWVRKDSDGEPVDAGTFARASAGSLSAVDDASAIIGTATYRGGAAGKFAVSDSGTPANDNSGHFTADATLEADFNANPDKTVSGTIDNFTLNDTAKVPWKVSLEESTIASGAIEGSNDTKWSLDGENFSAVATTSDWTANFYQGGDDDDNGIPNTVIGEFTSQIGSTHHMEGAFGANEQ